MRWPRGGLARIIVDLLYEIGGAPGEPGVTVDQLTKRAMDRPPQGLWYSAQEWYATHIMCQRVGIDTVRDVIADDGAQGITILSDGQGNPYFTTAQAVRAYLAIRLGQYARDSSWLVRDGDRYRLASESAGPSTRDHGIYNATARAHLDVIDQAHAAYVSAKVIVERIDGDAASAQVLLKGLLPKDNRKAFHERRKDHVAMLRAFPKLDPGQQREILMALAERSIANDNER
jgi:hypothetical protein